MSIDSTLDALDPLAHALRARNFEVFVAVRIASPIENKINVIKEVRALTGVGLKDAKDAVEQQQIILDSLPPDQAERVSERLAAAGGHSSLLLVRAHLYAYVPEHPRRGAQTCERLTVVGQTLELAQGQLGRWGSTRVLPIDDGELLAVLDRQRASWAAAGWCEAGSELEILQRVSARNEELEARISAAEGEALTQEAAVYGDWLLAQGDPRGHVASAALSLDAAREDTERAQRTEALRKVVAEHAVHLFGPSTWPLIDNQLTNSSWIGPMLASATLDELQDNEHVRLLERLLALPVCAGLRKLAITSRFTEHLGDLLAHSSCASSLRSLSLQESFRVSFTDVRFERLEELELTAGELRFAGLSVPALRRMSLFWRQPFGPLADHLEQLDAPSLADFEFGALTYDFWEQHHGPLHRQLATLLELPAFARLRTLTLRSEPSSLPYSAGLAQALARVPARKTLEHVDLREASLTPEARAELDAVRGGPLLMLPEP